MDLTHIDELKINGKNVVSISSDALGGYVWNKRYVLGFFEPDGSEITSYNLYHGINNVFPDVIDPTPPAGYDFVGWNPQLPTTGSIVLQSNDYFATYNEQNLDTILYTIDGQSYRFQWSGQITVDGIADSLVQQQIESDVDKIVFGRNVTGFEDNFYVSIAQNFPVFSRTSQVTIPSSVQSIPYGFLYHGDHITSVTIEDGVEFIDESAFYYCTRLESIVIPASVQEINHNAFKSCTGLRDVTLPSKIQLYDDSFDQDYYLAGRMLFHIYGDQAYGDENDTYNQLIDFGVPPYRIQRQ